jgi:hypothetical protein
MSWCLESSFFGGRDALLLFGSGKAKLHFVYLAPKENGDEVTTRRKNRICPAMAIRDSTANFAARVCASRLSIALGVRITLKRRVVYEFCFADSQKPDGAADL